MSQSLTTSIGFNFNRTKTFSRLYVEELVFQFKEHIRTTTLLFTVSNSVCMKLTPFFREVREEDLPEMTYWRGFSVK